MNPTPARGTPTQVGVASLLFFISGWSALSYEIVWFKRASHLWGSSSLAMAAVVAAFLFGLGCGALLFGRLADRSDRPLRLYGRLELGIALAAILVPFEFGWIADTAASLQVSAQGRPLALAATRFGLTLAVLGPACLMMGGTLPLIIRQFTGPSRSVGGATSWLYATNTLGGAAGAWVSGFHLLPALGIGATGNLAVCANVLAGVGALALARGLAPRPPEPRSAPEPAVPLRAAGDTRATSTAVLLVCATLTGFASLTLQMLWVRQIALVIGGSTYAFTATLAVFVLGLGGGSLLFKALAPRRESLQLLIAGAALGVLLFTLAGLAAGPALAELAGEVQRLRGNATFDALLAIGVAAVFQGGATLGMGLLFPALVALRHDGARRPGRAVGSVFAANTLGAIVGAGTTTLLTLPGLGSFLGFRVALACYVLVLVLLFPPVQLPRHRASLAAALGCLVLLLATWQPQDPRAMNLGRYVMGNQGTGDLQPGTEVAFFEEGPTSNVLVLAAPVPAGRTSPEGPTLTVRVNGKVDGGSGADMETQLALAYLPRFLRPEARKVLVIGMGTGTTAGASLLFDQTEVVCCEIEPAIIEAAKLFGPVNHQPHASERLRIYPDDGRGFVQGSEERFDLIISEPSNPWVAGVGNLYTAEFYGAASRRLNPDGLFAQWVQTYALTPVEYALVARTMLSVFPYCVLVRITSEDTILIAGQRPILPSDRAALLAAQGLVDRNPIIEADLRRYLGSEDVRSLLLERVILDETDLRNLTDEYGGRELNTDANLRLEFDAPRRLFSDRRAAEQLTQAFFSAATPRVLQNAFLDWGCGPDQIEALRRIKNRLFAMGRFEHGRSIVQLAQVFAPDDAEFLADELLFEQYANTVEFQIASERLLGLSLLESYRLGKSLVRMGRADEARIVLEALSVKAPDSATCWSSLATVYAVLGLSEEAEEALNRAAQLDPLDDLTVTLKATLDARQ